MLKTVVLILLWVKRAALLSDAKYFVTVFANDEFKQNGYDIAMKTISFYAKPGKLTIITRINFYVYKLFTKCFSIKGYKA